MGENERQNPPYTEYFSTLFGVEIVKVLHDLSEDEAIGELPPNRVIADAARAAGRIVAWYYERTGNK